MTRHDGSVEVNNKNEIVHKNERESSLGSYFSIPYRKHPSGFLWFRECAKWSFIYLYVQVSFWCNEQWDGEKWRKNKKLKFGGLTRFCSWNNWRGFDWILKILVGLVPRLVLKSFAMNYPTNYSKSFLKFLFTHMNFLIQQPYINSTWSNLHAINNIPLQKTFSLLAPLCFMAHVPNYIIHQITSLFIFIFFCTYLFVCKKACDRFFTLHFFYNSVFFLPRSCLFRNFDSSPHEYKRDSKKIA